MRIGAVQHINPFDLLSTISGTVVQNQDGTITVGTQRYKINFSAAITTSGGRNLHTLAGLTFVPPPAAWSAE